MSIASLELPLGLAMLVFGVVFGARHWLDSWHNGELTSAGTVMLSAITSSSASSSCWRSWPMTSLRYRAIRCIAGYRSCGAVTAA